MTRLNCSDPLTLPLVMPENVTFKEPLPPTIATNSTVLANSTVPTDSTMPANSTVPTDSTVAIISTELHVKAELGLDLVLKCPIDMSPTRVSWFHNGIRLVKSKIVSMHCDFFHCFMY